MRVAAVLLCASMAMPVAAQPAEHHHHASEMSVAVERLVEQARTATEMYVDRSVAIAHGYRRVGRDLPMMGEHWLNTRLLIDGGFDVTRPPILTYLEVDGQPVLTGVVFAVPLDSGQVPPNDFGSDAMWHEHNGSIDEEALVPEHHTMPSAAKGTRVAFLHVWTKTPFNKSIFDAENWALPFVRAKVPVPEHFSIAAAKCLSVANGYRDYFLDLNPSTNPSAFDECAKLPFKRGVSLSPEDIDALDAAWHRAAGG